MCQPATPAPASVPFEAMLPVVVVTAERLFRDVRCPQTRDDAVAEVVALAWVGYRFRPACLNQPETVQRFACDCAAAVRAGCRHADAAGG